MRSAVVLLSMLASIMAEAPSPYHLPRPAAHAPPFSYSAGAVQAPPPSPQHLHPRPQPQLQPHFIQYPLQPAIAPQSIQGSGYQYQQPNIAPTYVQPAPQPQPLYHHHPSATQPIPVGPPHPLYYPQQQYAQPQPPPSVLPSLTYGQPQPYIGSAPRHELPALPIQPQPAFSAPQPQPATQYYQPQVTHQQGYSYQQPHAQAIQYTSQIPLQAQPLSNNAVASALSSYQADSNQYSSGSVQSHNEALDSTVVNRVQNIIKDNEHSSARNAGYVSLVSGVSLEGARPSIEISSFVHNSPLTTSDNSGPSSGASSSSSQSSSSSTAVSGPSQNYGFPSVTANSHDTSVDSNLAFLPQNKPATSYGTPQ